MVLATVERSQSWDRQAAEYRAIAENTPDALERLGYLQRAEYCDAMAARQARVLCDDVRAIAN
jgi:hypothetical protein